MLRTLAIASAALFLLAPPSGERIEARVNDAILTTSELNRMLAPLFRQYELSFRGAELALRKEETREAAVRSWIENELILQKARSLEDFRIDRMEVERMFEEERSKFPSPEEFERALGREGMTEMEFKEMLEDRYRVRALTFQRVTGLVSVSPREIIEYYRENEADYREEERARISMILIPADETPARREAARTVAETLRDKLREGADFADLARRHSGGPRAEGGGDFGFIEKGTWRTRLDEAAFALEVGEFSDVVETELGFHLLLCTGRKEASLKPLEEAWEEIEDRLFQEEWQNRHQAWIESLKSRALVIVGEEPLTVE